VSLTSENRGSHNLNRIGTTGPAPSLVPHRHPAKAHRFIGRYFARACPIGTSDNRPPIHRYVFLALVPQRRKTIATDSPVCISRSCPAGTSDNRHRFIGGFARRLQSPSPTGTEDGNLKPENVLLSRTGCEYSIVALRSAKAASKSEAFAWQNATFHPSLPINSQPHWDIKPSTATRLHIKAQGWTEKRGPTLGSEQTDHQYTAGVS
jgi:hypothetical protein